MNIEMICNSSIDEFLNRPPLKPVIDKTPFILLEPKETLEAKRGLFTVQDPVQQSFQPEHGQDNEGTFCG